MQKLTSTDTLNIDHALGKARNRVYRVGIELEGGWVTLPKGTNVERDGSVRFRDVAAERLAHIGELPSPPLEVSQYPNWMKAYYPVATNETCGMHVHMSFKSAFTYQQLMTPKYPATIIEYMVRWAKKSNLESGHPLWPRLAGLSEYCQTLFQADEQASATTKGFDHHSNGHRYTVINYCWSRYNTLECRLLPMMKTVDVGIAAVQEIINITNAFLVASAKREKRVVAKHIIDDPEMREEKKVYV